MATGKAWTGKENQLFCAAYAGMLVLEQNGHTFNKSAIRRAVLRDLDGRSAGSYEMKACNLSALLNERGAAWIKGYKPLSGAQASLFEWYQAAFIRFDRSELADYARELEAAGKEIKA